MAQNIKLKRSSVPGKVPTTSQLEAGEIAINTADGKLYFERDDSTIQTIVTTNTPITGSIQVTGGFTGSLFGTSSWAIDALAAVTASYAATASSADSFTIRTALTASNLIYPTADGTNNQAIITDGAGNLIFGNPNSDNTVINIKNVSGGPIAKGTPLYITGSGTSGNLVGVWPADAGNPARMPAGVIAGEDLPNNGDEGIGLINGFINGVNTSAFASGDQVYVAVGGGYTNVAPTGSALVQKLGNVEKVGSSNGSGVINGPNAARSVPNINPGYSWVGSSNWVAEAVPTASFLVTQAVSASYASTASYINTLNQDVNIFGNLTVYGTSSFTYVTSSQLDVAQSFISVNIFEPAERFGGLKVYDSGSLSHLATASLAWDSLNNHWVYQNASGSTYSGGMLLSGPRNTGSLGDEPSLTRWFVARSDGGDHLNNTQIYSSGSTTIVTGSFTTSGKVYIETVDNYGSDPDKFLSIANNEIVYRTGTQLLSDIGGQAAGTFVQNAGLGGVANYIMRYEDSNSATTSSIYEDTSGRIGIKTATPGAELDVNGSAIVSGSLTVVGTATVVQQGIQVSGITSLAIASISTTTYRGAFFDYVLSSDDQVNRRAGTLTLVWTASDIEWKDTSTMDIGNTDGAEFAPTNSGGNANIILSLPSGDWTVRGHLRYM